MIRVFSRVLVGFLVGLLRWLLRWLLRYLYNRTLSLDLNAQRIMSINERSCKSNTCNTLYIYI